MALAFARTIRPQEQYLGPTGLLKQEISVA